MDAKCNKYAICFGEKGAKQSALFFDHVLPLTLDEIIPSSDWGYGVKGTSPHKHRRGQTIFKSLLGSGRENVLFSRADSLRSIHNYYSSVYQGDYSFSEYLAEKYNSNDIVLPSISANDVLKPIIDGLGFNRAAVVFPETVTLGEGADDDNSVSIFNLSLVDAECATWEQILELRNDDSSSAKLRNLRLFFEDSFDGKDKLYIEYSLNKAIEDYYGALDKHGFTTKNGMWSLLFSKESAFGYGVAAMLNILYEEPISALSTGVGINLANLYIYYAKRKYDLNNIKKNHPVAYLIDTKNKLDGDKDKK